MSVISAVIGIKVTVCSYQWSSRHSESKWVGVRGSNLGTEAFLRNVFGLDTYQALDTKTLKHLTISERFATGGMF